MSTLVGQPGRFITVEGGEGAGKSLQLSRLADWLDAVLPPPAAPVLRTREPGGAPGAEAIRALLVTGDTGRWDPLTEVLLHTAARREHMVQTVWPALAARRWVVCDRFGDSTMAYQGYGHGLGAQAVATAHALAVAGTEPDLTLLLDVPVEVGLARVAAAGRGSNAISDATEDRYERMGHAFHQRVRDGFLAAAEAAPDRCVVVDATATPDAVAAQIRHVVADRLSIIAADPTSSARA